MLKITNNTKVRGVKGTYNDQWCFLLPFHGGLLWVPKTPFFQESLKSRAFLVHISRLNSFMKHTYHTTKHQQPGDSMWPFDSLVGGHQQPFPNGHKKPSPKGHQQNCQQWGFLSLGLFTSLISVVPPSDIQATSFSPPKVNQLNIRMSQGIPMPRLVSWRIRASVSSRLLRKLVRNLTYIRMVGLVFHGWNNGKCVGMNVLIFCVCFVFCPVSGEKHDDFFS